MNGGGGEQVDVCIGRMSEAAIRTRRERNPKKKNGSLLGLFWTKNIRHAPPPPAVSARRRVCSRRFGPFKEENEGRRAGHVTLSSRFHQSERKWFHTSRDSGNQSGRVTWLVKLPLRWTGGRLMRETWTLPVESWNGSSWRSKSALETITWLFGRPISQLANQVWIERTRRVPQLGRFVFLFLFRVRREFSDTWLSLPLKYHVTRADQSAVTRNRVTSVTFELIIHHEGVSMKGGIGLFLFVNERRATKVDSLIGLIPWNRNEPIGWAGHVTSASEKFAYIVVWLVRQVTWLFRQFFNQNEWI